MRIGIPGEIQANENRVAATPDTVGKLQKLGYEVIIESGAGEKASFGDTAFAEAGAQVGDRAEVWSSDIVMKVNPPTDDEIALLKDGASLASFIWPGQDQELMEKLSQRNINVLALDSVPRLSPLPVTGCTQLHGQHCWLSCSCGSISPLWSLL